MAISYTINQGSLAQNEIICFSTILLETAINVSLRLHWFIFLNKIYSLVIETPDVGVPGICYVQ